MTLGGYPAGRPTLVVGGPGSGKTLLATAFLVQGALDGEPGVLVSFDELPSELEVNTSSLGYDLVGLQQQRLLSIEHVQLDRQLIIHAGEFDLEALFIRLDYAVCQIGAKRVVLDSIDTLFAGVPDEAVLRSELRRLFSWLKERGLSTLITGERGERTLSRHGIEEYISDCVIFLDARIQDELSTRRLRIVKYRGTSHGSNEYPFLIDSDGITVLPVTSLTLNYVPTTLRLPTGIRGLDDMLGGDGFYVGSSVLISGGPGTGKTSAAAQIAAAVCQRGQKCIYFAFEEPEGQLIRNMQTIGIDLQPFVGREFVVQSARPTLHGLESHLATMMHLVLTEKPDLVVVDPLTALRVSGTASQSEMMVLRLIDFLKTVGVTAIYLSVQDLDSPTELNISSLMDTWIALRNVRSTSKLDRCIYVVKSRGMAHTADVRRFLITCNGIEIEQGGSNDLDDP